MYKASIYIGKNKEVTTENEDAYAAFTMIAQYASLYYEDFLNGNDKTFTIKVVKK